MKKIFLMLAAALCITSVASAQDKGDWAIVPYNSASQSGIIIDAYKYSRPIVAFAVGAIPEQVDAEKSGYLVEAGNNEKFADKLKEAVDFVRKCMEEKPFPEFSLPLIAEAAYGKSFGTMNEI